MAERRPSTTIPKVDPPLTKVPNNYMFWQAKIQPLLDHNNVWEVVSLAVPTPIIPELVEERVVRGRRANQNGQVAANAIEVDVVVPGNEEEVEQAIADAKEWKTKNTFARLIIMNSIDSSCASMLSGLTEASAMWKKLADHFIPKATNLVATTLSQIATYKATDDLDLTVWTTDMVALREKQGGVLLDATFSELVLLNLPDSPTWVTFTQVASRTGFAHSDELITMINTEFERLHARNPDRLASVYTARAQANKRRANSVSAPATVAAAGGSYRRSRSAGPPSICSNCHRMGHLPTECFDKGGGKEGQFPKSWDDARVARWKETGDKRRAGESSNVKRAAQTEATITEEQDEDVQTIVAFVSTPSVHSAFAGSTRNAKWNHDSCSTDHVAWNREDFTEYREITPIVVEGFDKSMTTEAIGRGRVILSAVHNGRRTNLELTEVLHMPGARNNLVSGIRLAKMGVVTRLDNSGVTLVHEKSSRVVCGGRLATFFELDVEVVKPVQAPSVSAAKPTAIDAGFGIVGWDT